MHVCHTQNMHQNILSLSVINSLMFCVQFGSLSLGRADTRYFVKTFQTLQKAIGCWLARIWFAFNFLIQLTFIPFLGLFSVFSVYLSFNIAQANGSWKTTFLRELPFLRIYASGGIVCSLSSPNVPCISYISPAQVICFSAVLFYELMIIHEFFMFPPFFVVPGTIGPSIWSIPRQASCPAASRARWMSQIWQSWKRACA